RGHPAVVRPAGRPDRTPGGAAAGQAPGAGERAGDPVRPVQRPGDGADARRRAARAAEPVAGPLHRLRHHHGVADGERGHPAGGAGRPQDRAPNPWGAAERTARLGPAAQPSGPPDRPARPPRGGGVPRPERRHGPPPGGPAAGPPPPARPPARPEPVTDPAPDDAVTERIPVVPASQPRSEPSLGRSSSLMALGSPARRITGVLRQGALLPVLGATVLNDSYTLSNTLPNIVYELLIGGALSSMMIPLLVRAQREDPDGGEAYTRKLITITGAALLLATAAGMLAAPLLTRLYL